MKKGVLLFLLCTFLFFAAKAEEAISFLSRSFPREAETVDLGEQEVTDWKAFLSFLAEFPNLRRVDMFATPVGRSEINRLVKAFPDLSFGWTIHLAADHYVRTDQTAFSTLHGPCPRHNNRSLDLLRYCTELRALDIGHNVVTDLSFLASLTKLRVLIVADNPGIRSLKPLAALKDLEYLELFGTGVTDISPLSELPHLMDLNLVNTRIRNWQLLKEMKSLKRLWLSIGNTGAEELQAALPDTLIVRRGHPTDNGWRDENSHYSVIREMFQGTEYIPFEDSY